MYLLNITRAGAYGNGTRRAGQSLAVVEFDGPPAEIAAAARRLSIDDADQLPGDWELMEDATMAEVLTALQNPDFVKLTPIAPEAEVFFDGDSDADEEESEADPEDEADENGLAPKVLAKPVAELDVDEDVRQALLGHSPAIATVADVVAFANANRGLTKIKGIGPVGEKAVIAAIDALAK